MKMHLGTMAGLTALLLAGGCTVGPDFSRPIAPVTPGYARDGLVPQPQGREAQRFLAGLDVPGQWWRQFGSPRLDTLVQQSLAGNPDLDAARAALSGAQASVKAQQGFYYPTVNGGLSVNSRRDATGTLASAQVNNQTYYTLFTPQLGISYSPDIFGMNDRAVEGLLAQVEAQRYVAEATYNTLISSLVSAVIRRAMLADLLGATQAQVEQDRQILTLLRRQRAMGQVADADIAAQQVVLAQTEAALPGLETQQNVQDNLIASLMGRLPAEAAETNFALAEFTLPRDLPLSLPAQLVDQRPDIRAAEAQIHAASAAVGVAVAARLPNVTLTADIGTVSSSLSSLLSPENLFWSLGAAAAQTLFDGGTLKARQKAAEATLDVAKAQYRRVLINAFQDVADTLAALAQDSRAVETARQSVDAANLSLDMALRRLRLGGGGTLAVLNARRAAESAKTNLIEAEANRLQDSAALFMALGGGWWNRTPANAAVPTDAKT